ncbi:DNA-binding barrel domain superfamily [Sesbania bispinosa]|nr:DNA-binding barrel domain superfamily [Sesbania bispinosa]
MIEQTFWEKFSSQIPEKCFLIDRAENKCHVSVKSNGHSVAFINGVDDICRCYKLEETHNVICTYFGSGEFEIVILNYDNEVMQSPIVLNNGMTVELEQEEVAFRIPELEPSKGFQQSWNQKR